MSTILIKNGMIVDGSGKLPYKGNVLIENDRIKTVTAGPLDVSADEVIDAEGKVVTPGFIDIHRHCDAKPLNDPSFADCMIKQGITTTVVGNCGISMTPAPASLDGAKEMYKFHEPVLGPIEAGLVTTYDDYLNAIEKVQMPLNFASMVGFGSVKISIKGFADTPFSQEELKKAYDTIDNALAAGAAGVSVGIMYIPECYTKTDEYAEILKAVGKHHAVVTAHIRGEGDSMVQSVKEIIEIGKKAGCAVEVSHFKSCGMKNWRKDIHTAIGLINEARAQGQDVSCDFYPYEGGSTSLTTMVPPKFVAGDMKKALAKMGTEEGIEEFRQLSSQTFDDWDNFAITLGWDRILISGVTKEHNRKYINKNVEQCAKEFGFKDSAEFVCKLLHDEDGNVAIINLSMCQDDIDTVAKLPYSIIISDAIYADTDTPHPRMYGAFPKAIREYVVERKMLSLEQTVNKMTALPASRMKLKDRGLLQEGYFADVNVFDLNEFRDNATFAKPTLPATGLYKCIMNGQVVLSEGQVIKMDAGKVVKVIRQDACDV